MQPGDVDIGAIGLEQPVSPFWTKAGDEFFKGSAFKNLATSDLGPLRVGCGRKMDRAAPPKEAGLGYASRWIAQEPSRRTIEPGDLRPAIAFQEKRRRAPRRMIAAGPFRLKDHRLQPTRQRRASARPSNSAANDRDVEIHGAGYEFESLAV